TAPDGAEALMLDDLSVYLAEFIGTAILTLLGCGVVAGVSLARSKSFQGGWIVVTCGWGMAVAMAVYIIGHISGGHINPAVTLGVSSHGDGVWAPGPGYVIAQLAGGAPRGVPVAPACFAHWSIADDKTTNLGVFGTTPAVRNPVANLITEIIGTAMLLLGVVGIGFHEGSVSRGGADLSELFANGLAPLLVGLLVFAIGLSLGGPTGYAIN